MAEAPIKVSNIRGLYVERRPNGLLEFSGANLEMLEGRGRMFLFVRYSFERLRLYTSSNAYPNTSLLNVCTPDGGELPFNAMGTRKKYDVKEIHFFAEEA